MPVPQCRVGRLVPLDRERALDDRPRLFERRHVAGGEHLHDDITKRRRLDGPRDHGPACRIGRELVEQAITRPAADDTNLLEARAGDGLERFEHVPVFEGQTLEDRPRIGGRARRLGLRGLPAVRRNRRRHVARVQEGRAIGIDQRPKREAIVRGGGR